MSNLIRYFTPQQVVDAVLNFNMLHNRPVARSEFPPGVNRDTLRKLVRKGFLTRTDVMNMDNPSDVQDGYWNTAFYKGLKRAKADNSGSAEMLPAQQPA